MVKRKTAKRIRIVHRYLGLFLGIQFLMWTISGLYFSWTDIDEIHGDHFKKVAPEKTAFSDLLGSSQLKFKHPIESLELLDIAGQPYYWINEVHLYDAITGSEKKKISEHEALMVAEQYVLSKFEVDQIKVIESVNAHHEYRGKPLPAYEISYKSDENLKAYIAIKNGEFQTVRHRDWRWFDFLWMTHTMDYQGRDDFNTFLLRAFSLLGLITVLSGFLLWFTSSPTIRKFRFKR